MTDCGKAWITMLSLEDTISENSAVVSMLIAVDIVLWTSAVEFNNLKTVRKDK